MRISYFKTAELDSKQLIHYNMIILTPKAADSNVIT